ncbi:hypothetical protein GTZ78_23495 [Streptomyces sp. SID8361]|uniref:hypothetical protein n=1 Tax=Streptomyces sp. MnatMP-M27 TaxID=1839768 RepID=UPI00081EEBD6|nr:hypothetical protein [Streptomyces sp. MnatMP-M27]MYU13572.1 hypothetical protein [Streptomyces sp. SID8361]SCG01306.1 hypothetical protein GA0115260_1061913 [Streptomyces sp. MnatMP-M27]
MKLAWQDTDVLDMPTLGTPITTLSGLGDIPGGYGAQLVWARTRAKALRTEFAATGTPDNVTTCDLVTLPYPTKFGLFRASRAIAPFLAITNRMLVVRWTESDGRRRVLLFEPSDVELGRNTPYFAALARRTPRPVRSLLVTEHGTVLGHLARLGIAPEDVDYLLFDHLHTQDLRRWIGTSTPQPDLGDGPVEPVFPHAKVIVQRHELLAMSELHPLQRPWYQPDAYRDVRPDAFLAVDGSLLLGPGVAVISTPGHVLGNQTLLLNTSSGIWASSENAIAAECLTPEHSRVPGIARWARAWQQEVVLNANTIETTAEQYNSLIIEKTLVDHAQADPRFLQFFPSSELTGVWTNPGTSPTFTHKAVTHR